MEGEAIPVACRVSRRCPARVSRIIDRMEAELCRLRSEPLRSEPCRLRREPFMEVLRGSEPKPSRSPAAGALV